MSVDDAIRAECRAHIGRQRVAEDSMSRGRAEKLAVMMGGTAPGGGLPPTWHWAYFTRAIPPDRIGHDGHETPGLFLPPVPFQRRMWASGEIRMRRPLFTGAPAWRISTVEDVVFKTGRSGDLCFVTVGHEISQAGEVCISEIQAIVYRDRGAAHAPLRQPDDPVPEGHFTHPDTLLLAYSSVTHNGHRIHWDRDFCRDVEGYPSLVVHGPLLATELCDAMRDGLRPCRFAYRATAPVFDTSPVRLDPGAPGAVRDGRIERSDGQVAMTATWAAL